MLEDVLLNIHNWFERERVKGDFAIIGGTLGMTIPEGQYFRIVGSVFNDGLHLPDDELVDEEFTGEVWLLAVPAKVKALAQDIADWQEKHGEAAESPFQSESFDGYSYTKTASQNSSGSATSGWQDAFRSRLNPWRKIA